VAFGLFFIRQASYGYFFPKFGYFFLKIWLLFPKIWLLFPKVEQLFSKVWLLFPKVWLLPLNFGDTARHGVNYAFKMFSNVVRRSATHRLFVSNILRRVTNSQSYQLRRRAADQVTVNKLECLYLLFWS